MCILMAEYYGLITQHIWVLEVESESPSGDGFGKARFKVQYKRYLQDNKTPHFDTRYMYMPISHSGEKWNYENV